MLALVRETFHMSNCGKLMTTRAKHTQQLVPSNAVIPNLDKGAPLERTFLAAYLSITVFVPHLCSSLSIHHPTPITSISI